MDTQDWARDVIADWDARFRAWSLAEGPITPEDEITPYSPAFSDDSIADVKRWMRSSVRVGDR